MRNWVTLNRRGVCMKHMVPSTRGMSCVKKWDPTIQVAQHWSLIKKFKKRKKKKRTKYYAGVGTVARCRMPRDWQRNFWQCYEYRFGTRFSLSSGKEYLSTGLFRHTVSRCFGVPKLQGTKEESAILGSLGAEAYIGYNCESHNSGVTSAN